jgi:hypothetical protein
MRNGSRQEDEERFSFYVTVRYNATHASGDLDSPP